MNDKGIKFGFIGCGQGGGKIADLFAQTLQGGENSLQKPSRCTP